MVFRKLTPNAVNRAVTTLDTPSGKIINVGKVLKALGAHPILTTFLGGLNGEFIRAGLAERGIETCFVAVKSPTRQCITVIDDSMHMELVEESRPVNPADFRKLMGIIKSRVSTCRAVVMSGTIATGGPVTLYRDCVRLATKAGVLSVVDAQRTALTEALKAGPGLIKANRTELAATVGRNLHSESDVIRAMRELYERGAQRVVVTAGSEPVLAFDGKIYYRVTAPRIKVANPIGSGDAFGAGVVWRLLRGDDLGEACRWGAAAGTANALSLMPGELERKDVERLVKKVVVR